MTTRELIELLQYLDPDLGMEVLVDGYEEDYTTVKVVRAMDLVLKPEPREWYFGEWTEWDPEYHDAIERAPKIVISRNQLYGG